MGSVRSRRAPRPLDDRTLRELALAYVGRFATTRSKLQQYLRRKVRERGWSGQTEPEIAAIAEAFADQGYIDDSSFALAKAQSLTARGYGPRRVVDSLRRAGVAGDDGSAAIEHSEDQAVAAALRFAERRRFGPFATVPTKDLRQREKALGAMIRAGHSFALAKAILDWPVEAPLDLGEIADRARRSAA